MSDEREMPGIIDWQELTGQSWLVIDLISIPIFSAIAGLLTNWTGVIMLFAPVRFTGFYMPGLKTLFPFLPRKLQILPTFAPGGILGFQGFIPARGEKMASLMVDKALSRIGSLKDFVRELDPDLIAAHIAKSGKSMLRPMIAELMEREHPQLWRDLSPRMKELVFQRIEDEMPALTQRAFAQIGDNIDQLVDVKLMCVMHMKRHPELLKEIIYGLGAPELRFMVKTGLLGAPMGFLLALYLQVHSDFFLLGWIPHWAMVLVGAAIIGIIVNVIAVKVVFTPGDPKPRWRCLWKQALFAKRQDQAAADLGHAFAYQVITVPNIANELLAGPRGDRTVNLLTEILSKEVKSILGPVTQMVRVAVGAREFDAIQAGAGSAALGLAPAVVEDEAFVKQQAEKIDKFCTVKLRELPPSQFMDLMYSAVEQDAWLLYAHGGFLGIFVGAFHILFFGA